MMRIFPTQVSIPVVILGAFVALSACGTGKVTGGGESGDEGPAGDVIGGDGAAASCADQVQNGEETDVDCGGDCAPCDDDAACREGDDCLSGVCTDDVCQTPSCEDGTQNGFESDVDCGGSCKPCPDLAACEIDMDCESLVCDSDECQEASCTDRATNGRETALNCGGPVCQACADDASCVIPDDCTSGVGHIRKTDCAEISRSQNGSGCSILTACRTPCT
ncbi:MAG: hypothetical protein A2289_09185 [Deltaproteobacteria bacterium RIFOXYA12_FULL_58_15]|nr:MAG: hypothetical protein A2289_09185 [Deltaproteobacteria bacterium RIFOXYA12_FULL_58_15]OGR14576.1 MAG: hypothetical protein A2341_04960 [Deltaproteobacteria bacterium RIFOXYB12_FULL_58_9]